MPGCGATEVRLYSLTDLQSLQYSKHTVSYRIVSQHVHGQEQQVQLHSCSRSSMLIRLKNLAPALQEGVSLDLLNTLMVSH